MQLNFHSTNTFIRTPQSALLYVYALCFLQSTFIHSNHVKCFNACSVNQYRHAPSTSYTHAVLTWPVEVQVTGLLFICVTCHGKAVVDTVMDWLEVNELQLDELLVGFRGCLCQCCVLQVPITDHYPVLVEGHSEVITCVSEPTADGEGSSSVEVVAELWVSKCSVVWLDFRRWYQYRCQSEACQRVI